MKKNSFAFVVLTGFLLGFTSPVGAVERIEEKPVKKEAKPVAMYRAEQAGDKLTVYAKGMNNTSGWKNELTVLPIDIYPPEFQFTQKRPDGIALQVITKFEVKIEAKAAKPVESIIVHDANGKHKVEVKQVK